MNSPFLSIMQLADRALLQQGCNDRRVRGFGAAFRPRRCGFTRQRGQASGSHQTMYEEAMDLCLDEVMEIS